MKTLTEKDVTFKLEIEPEDMRVEGNASAIDPKTDKEIADSIYSRLEDGDIWAWCCVTVTAEWNGIQGRDSLGGCSYKDETDFKKGGYWQDMKSQALEDLKRNIKDLQSKVKGVKV